jgi:hypothetical protein
MDMGRLVVSRVDDEAEAKSTVDNDHMTK